jgi:hypothetical protein
MSRKLTMEMAEDYTGYPARTLRYAVKRGELVAERPIAAQNSRLYFSVTDLDRWLEAIKVKVS